MAKTNHPFNQDVVQYNLKWIAQVHKPIVNKTSNYEEPMTQVFCTNFNALKSCEMQKMYVTMLIKNNTWNKDR